MKKLILLSALLVPLFLVIPVIAQTTPANQKYKYSIFGIQAGMTKNDVTYTLFHRRKLRFEIGDCTPPGGNHQYTCHYNLNGEDHAKQWIIVFFQRNTKSVMWENDPMVGFSLKLRYEGPLQPMWKDWYDDIVQQLGVKPIKQASNLDEYVVRQAEWKTASEKVKLSFLTGSEFMVIYDAVP